MSSVVQRRAFRAGREPGQAGREPGQAGTLHPAVSFTGTVTLMADVSEFQPNVADAVYVQWSHAVGIRAMYGDAHDDLAWFGGARRGAFHSAGIKFLAIYQYGVAGQSGAAQAQAFHDLVGPIQEGEVFVFDFEEGSRQMVTDWFNKMLSLYGPGIVRYLWVYSGLFFGEDRGVLPVDWLAAYQNNEPASPHTLWQFSEGFSVPGIGLADCSAFHGTVDQLAALGYHRPVPVTPGVWSFDVLQTFDITSVGKNSVAVTFSAPAGLLGDVPKPAPGVARYEFAIVAGATLDGHPNIASYPRHQDKGSSNPEDWSGGGLQPAKQYTLGGRAQLADGTHSGPWVTRTFWTDPA